MNGSRFLAAILLLAVVRTPVEAQRERHIGYGIGISSTSTDMGLHALLKGEVAATPAFRFRAEAMFQQLDGNAFFGLGSIVFSPAQKLGAPYAIASVGVAGDGPDFTWGVGMGANVDTSASIPLFLEFRALIEPYAKDHAMATVGVRF